MSVNKDKVTDDFEAMMAAIKEEQIELDVGENLVTGFNESVAELGDEADLASFIQNAAFKFDYDEYEKSGFDITCWLFPGEPEKANKFLKELQQKAQADPKSDDAKHLKELMLFHKAYERSVKTAYSGG